MLDFSNRSTAGDATIVNSSTFGMAFLNWSTAGNAFITTRSNSETVFFDRSDGGTARFETEAGSVVDFSGSRGPDNDRRINAGSIGGAGTYYIGRNNTLVTGGNNRSSEVSGVIADVDPCGCSPVGPGSLEKVGTGTMILSGVNTYTGTTGGDRRRARMSTARLRRPSLTTVLCQCGADRRGHGRQHRDRHWRHFPARQRHAGFVDDGVGQSRVRVGRAVSGAAQLHDGDLRQRDRRRRARTAPSAHRSRAGSNVLSRYTILTAAGGRSGTFTGVDALGLPANVVASLSYDATNAYLNLALNFAAAAGSGGLNGNQANVAAGLTNAFNAGGIPLAFAALNAQGLTRVSGEAATGAQQATFDVMDRFLNVVTDPFLGERATGMPGSVASSFAEDDAALGYAARNSRGRIDNAHAAIFTKAPPRVEALKRWNVWAARLRRHQRTEGNAAAGSSTFTDRIYGGAAGVDYRISQDTMVGVAMGGAGTNYGLANGLGGGRSDVFQAGIYGRHVWGAAYVSGALAYGWQDVTTDRTTVDLRPVARTLRCQCPVGTARGRLSLCHAARRPDALRSGAIHHVLPAGLCRTGHRRRQHLCARLCVEGRDGLAQRAWLARRSIIRLAGRHPDPARPGCVGAQFRSQPRRVGDLPDAPRSRVRRQRRGGCSRRRAGDGRRRGEVAERLSVAATFEGEFSRVTESYAGKGVARYTW